MTLRVVDGRARVDAGSGSGGGAGAAIESTDVEVAEVVTLVLDHARTRAGQSLAVVALNAVHARRIQEALGSARTALSGEDAVLEALSSGGADAAEKPAEPFVVVDGRHAAVGSYDAVILTVGYGKTTHGGVLHRFPELAGPFARRRLASALTIARRQLTVVSSMSGSDLDPDRLEPAGLMLRDLLLQLAVEGADVSSPETTTVPTSRDPLMADLARRLRREGLVVDEAVGVGTRVVELAVRDPREEATGGRYVVGIEGDGESYASLVGSRTRDRLWPQALDRRGWRTVRVWSTDLFRDPAREVSRLVGLVREATGGAVSGAAPTPAAFDSGANTESGPGSDREPGDASRSSAGGAAAKDAKDKRGTGLRKRRRADQTTDDTDLGWGERPDSDSHDQWLQEQRPPHWE